MQHHTHTHTRARNTTTFTQEACKGDAYVVIAQHVGEERDVVLDHGEVIGRIRRTAATRRHGRRP